MNVSTLTQTETFHFQGEAIQLRCLEKGDAIHRLYRYPGGDFRPAPSQHRSGRLDPPEGRSSEYGMLYAADTLKTAALECGALLQMPTDPPTFAVSAFANTELPELQHATLRAQKRVKFVDFTDIATAHAFGLNLNSALDHLPPWRASSARVVAALHQADGCSEIVGISYYSKRAPQAINYALVQGRYHDKFICEHVGLALQD